ncbi:MAG: AAA family ATPase, partial [Deltaproteobacteria bacterium]|nr:AAA family ATPase [Deltaproteobacteria bacterium]
MKELPVSDSSFADIISQDLLYADKTAYIYEMIKPSTRCCFLSRPRRFGKTLLLDTIENLFLGNRELFRGLWIDSKEANYDFKKHPVVLLSMAYSEMGSPDELKKRIKNNLLSIAGKEEVRITEDSYGEILEQLVEGLSEKHGSKAVVLVDEYDTPVTALIEDQALAQANSAVLRSFYASLKKSIRHIRFALVTGITRFALTAMDSGPNNFYDLSLDPQFGGVCGFTISEFDNYFGDRMEGTLKALIEKGQMGPGTHVFDLRERIMAWYDGYNWLGPERVLNPYSILNFFKAMKFGPYWPRTGKPGHLSALIQEKPLDFVQPRLDGYADGELTKAEIGTLEAAPVLFNSGYLTIDESRWVEEGEGDDLGQHELYSLRLPNKEVRGSYRTDCLDAIFRRSPAYLKGLGPRFLDAVSGRDSMAFARLFGDILA